MSENIKEALEYAVELAGQEDKVTTVGGKNYFDVSRHTLKELNPKKYPDILGLATLNSLIDYYTNDINEITQQRTVIVVESPTDVRVYTEDDELEKRTLLIQVSANLPVLSFGNFMAADEFNIMLQSKFLNQHDRENVIEFTSHLIVEDGAEIEDDGISQITTVKKGIASRAKAKAPNPVELAPYRTFLGVEQPKSDFILRINNEGKLALFEADGGLWKLNAVERIQNYISEKLVEHENVFVLA